MYVEQLYTDCLAEAAYYIESNGEAAVVDPLRDIQEYVDRAKNNSSACALSKVNVSRHKVSVEVRFKDIF